MANHKADNKLHGFSKSERLCNFSLKKLLFTSGQTFQQYPFKVFWKVTDKNLEDMFFSKSVTTFESPLAYKDQIRAVQNPSYPYKKVARNALFSHPAQCLTGVSSRAQTSAAKRNYLKRLIREAYRQNKAPFYSFLEHIDSFCLLAFIYTSKTTEPYNRLEKKIIVSLQKIEQHIINATDQTSF